MSVHDHRNAHFLPDFMETAACIANLDAVVSVDTSVANLTGALGVPLVAMLPMWSEWRWGFGDRSPWYASAVPVRQTEPGDWGSVVGKVAAIVARRDWRR